MGKKNLYHLLLPLLFLPTVVLANGVSPVLNFFHKDTWLPASVVTVVIVLLESLILRWRIKSVPYIGVLWRSFLMNAASSLTGSVLLIAFSRDSFFIWDTMSFVLPLFLITIATEIPMLHGLYGAERMPWKRSVMLGLGMNASSYLAVIILEVGLLVGWVSYAGHLDKRELMEWNHTNLLSQATGLIYATDAVGADGCLKVYDFETRQWTTLTNGPLIDSLKWDVEGGTIAFVQSTHGDRRDSHIIVARLHDFKTVLKIPAVQLSDSPFDNGQGVTDLALSPDQQKLAILFKLADAVAPKSRSSYFHLGDKCQLIIVDIATGQEIAKAPRWASGQGVCWLADSSRVLFPSFDDESLYRTTRLDVSGDRSFGIGYASDDRFRQGLYLFDVETFSVVRFTDGQVLSLATDVGSVLIQDATGLALLDPSGNLQERVNIDRLGHHGAVVSPSGSMIVAGLQRHVPFFGGGRLVLFDKAVPDVRHILDDGWVYRFDWTTERKGK